MKARKRKRPSLSRKDDHKSNVVCDNRGETLTGSRDCQTWSEHRASRLARQSEESIKALAAKGTLDFLIRDGSVRGRLVVSRSDLERHIAGRPIVEQAELELFASERRAQA